MVCSCTYVRGGEWCGRVRETTYLLSEHTKPYVKGQLVGLLLGLVDTLKVIIRFGITLGIKVSLALEHLFCLLSPLLSS